jgi:HlyD family secretion protein
MSSHRRPFGTALLLALVVGCRGEPEPDAYGTFEATEVVVSSRAAGTLLWFGPGEGERVVPGTLLGLVDTTALALERAQLVAQQATTRARALEAERQIGVLDAQRSVAERAYARTQRLAAERAATAQQLDQAERDVRVLRAQRAAATAQRQTAAQEVATVTARLAQLDERLRESRIESPIEGTVLATYARAGELVPAGQALFRVAALDTLELRAYVVGPQLAAVRLGQTVTVHVDGRPVDGAASGDEPADAAWDGARTGRVERRALSGRISWISSRAEFTPTPVQTRDERAELVYAIKVRVPNPDGRLKIGMPADVTLRTPGAPAAGPARPARTAQVGS